MASRPDTRAGAPPATRSRQVSGTAGRWAAWNALVQIERGQPLDTALERLDAVVREPRDRSLARALVFGCLRWQLRLDHVAAHYLAGSPPGGLSRGTRQLLRLGLYQLLWLERVPDHAAIHTTVELAKRVAHPGVAALVNAVLRHAQREPGLVHYPSEREAPGAHLALWHSHPQWLVERWLERFGRERTRAMLEANNRPAPLTVAVNSTRTSSEQLAAELQAAGLSVAPVAGFPGYLSVDDGGALFASAAYAAGKFFVQDVSAALPVALLDPSPGALVLDLCSAPGGKTLQLALRAPAPGRVVAADRSRQRLLRVEENRRRLGLAGVTMLVQDARVPGLRPASFPYVLADVPCSATGTLGRHPDIRWRRTPGQLTALARRQREILAAAFAATAPGGVLVYSTCSLEPEENEQVVERFLDDHPDALLEPAAQRFPQCPWAGRYVLTLPGREPGDGGFAARIRRRLP